MALVWLFLGTVIPVGLVARFRMVEIPCPSLRLLRLLVVLVVLSWVVLGLAVVRSLV